MKRAVKKRISAGEILCTGYLSLLGVMLPLTVHDAYFDITRTKATVFWVLSGLLVLAAVLWLCLDKEGRGTLTPPSLPDGLLLAFVLTHILSSLLFRPASAFLAPDNRFQGILSFALYGAVFLLLRRHASLSPLVRFALGLGFSLCALLAVGELFGLDLLGLRAVSPEVERPRFFSTVGNVSFLSALCVLFLALAGTLAIGARKRPAAAIWAFVALLALCGGMAARTEGFVLGALGFLLLLPLFCRETEMLRRIPLLWALSAAAALGFSLAMKRWALYRMSTLGALVCTPVVLLVLCAGSMALWLWLRRGEDSFVLRVRRFFGFGLGALCLLGLVFLVLANTLWRERLPAPYASVLVFSPSWGTDRGAEWLSFWQMFRASSLPQKLIGSGAGSLAEWDRMHRLFSDAVTDSAHNEYLHYLLTGGLLGLGAYLALLATALRGALRKPSPVRTALGLAVAAYSLQAAVNIAQPFTTPLFFPLLALLCSDRDPTSGEEAEGAIIWRVALALLAARLLLAAYK